MNFRTKKLKKIIEYLNQGQNFVTYIDAGTPAISDQGKLLIKKCFENKINVIPIPGASSVTASMSVSGFKDQFLFYGFLPKKEKELNFFVTNLSDLSFCLVFLHQQ